MHNTFTPSLPLVLFCQLIFVFVIVVIGGLWKAMRRVRLPGHAMHVDVNGEVMLWVAAT